MGATVRRASPGVLLPRLPMRSPSDHSLFAGSPDLLTYGCAHIGFDSLQFTIDEIKNEPEDSFFISWWRWRVTIHYHGKRKMDYLDKTGTAPGLALINISKFIHQFLSQWVSSEHVFSLHKQDIRFHLLLYV